MNHLLSKNCNTCKTTEGVYLYCIFIFECPLINDWFRVCQEIDIIFKTKLAHELVFCVLGIQSAALDLSPSSLKLLKVLLFSATRCVFPQWISDSVPAVSQWIKSIKEPIPLEAISVQWMNHLTCTVPSQ